MAIDVDRNPSLPSGYEVFNDGGRTATGADALEWAKRVSDYGVRCISPTSKATDGARTGFDLPLIRMIASATGAEVVASGGAGTMEHFREAAEAGATVLLAASVFHFGLIPLARAQGVSPDVRVQGGAVVRPADHSIASKPKCSQPVSAVSVRGTLLLLTGLPTTTLIQAAPTPASPWPLNDKTLIAWVSPANLTQRGGSVLTIEKPGAVFDAIVFGELAPATWMPGSDGFRRTQREQVRFPQGNRCQSSSGPSRHRLPRPTDHHLPQRPTDGHLHGRGRRIVRLSTAWSCWACAISTPARTIASSSARSTTPASTPAR